ncbi:MAG: hypothetical protein ACUVQ6_07785 [Dissulfurimicrobium sp.]|uniref:hypothetical protein n=1 Tax=Dissulfurimicrobium sp. TaxID=2022436 RepID=UPI00404AAC39
MEQTRRPVKNYSSVRLFLGVKAYICKLVLIEKQDSVLPSGKAFAQLRLNEAVAALPFSPFLSASLSPQEIIGGGCILEISDRKWRARHEGMANLLYPMPFQAL